MTSPETLLPQAATDAAMKLAMDTLKQVPKRDPQVLEAHLTAVLIVFWGALWGTEEPTAPPAPLPGKRERALFQAWARDRHWNLSLRADGERYMSESTQEGWYAWKGRAALSSPPAIEAAPADYPPPDAALAEFTDYFVRNYPGPDTIITDPKWHAPKLFRAAQRAISRAGLRSGVSADPLPLTDTYVQPVPDKCDRITWRGQYYHLPVSSQSQPLVEPTMDMVNAARAVMPELPVDARHLIGSDELRVMIRAALLRAVQAGPQHQVKKGELS